MFARKTPNLLDRLGWIWLPVAVAALSAVVPAPPPGYLGAVLLGTLDSPHQQSYCCSPSCFLWLSVSHVEVCQGRNGCNYSGNIPTRIFFFSYFQLHDYYYYTQVEVKEKA